MATLRAQFIKTISALMDEDESLVLLLGDISTYAFRQCIERHPSRAYNLGIAEQASVSIAAGLAIEGFVPIFHTIDAFAVRRCFEQVYLDFGVQRLPGLFITVGGGQDYKSLGPTHMCEHGMKLMAEVPGMRVTIPRTAQAVDHDIRHAASSRDLCYIRLEESLAIHDAAPKRPKLHLPLSRGPNGYADESAGAQR
jgi:transketolase